MVIREVKRLIKLGPNHFDDARTQQTLDTNYKRFYNVEWATKQLEKYFDEIKQYSSRW